jgi:hypothetical protein
MRRLKVTKRRPRGKGKGPYRRFSMIVPDRKRPRPFLLLTWIAGWDRRLNSPLMKDTII